MYAVFIIDFVLSAYGTTPNFFGMMTRITI